MFDRKIHSLIISLFVFLASEAVTATNEPDPVLPVDDWIQSVQQNIYDQPTLVREQALLYLRGRENSDSTNVFKVYKLISDTYVAVGDYTKSREYLTKTLTAIDEQVQHSEHVAVLFAFGVGYFDERNHAKAYEYFSSALNKAKQNKLMCWELRTKAEIANILIDVGDFEHARKLLDPIVDDTRCSNFSIDIILATLLANQREYDSAFKLFDRYLNSAAERDSLLYITETKAQYVIFLVKAGEIDKAKLVMKEVSHAIENIGVPNPTRLYEWALANLTAVNDDPERALSYALTALSDDVPIPQEFRLKVDREALPLIIKLQTELGQFDQAQKMTQRLLENNTKYFANNRAAILGISEARLNLAERDGEISLLNQQAQVASLRLERQLLVSAILSLLAIVFIVCSVVLYRNNRRKQRFNLLLEKNVQRLNARAKGAEVELAHKQTLFEESHHRLKNNFHFLVNVLELQRSRLGSETTSKISNVLLDAANRIQAMAVIHHFADPSVNSNTPLKIDELLKNLVEQTYQVADDSVKITVSCQDIELNSEVSKSLVLIVNELLCNAQKHAFDKRGGNVSVTLTESEKCGRVLMVEDDGQGTTFNFDDKLNSSMGLKLVKSIVEQIGGDLRVASNHLGTRWTVEF